MLLSMELTMIEWPYHGLKCGKHLGYSVPGITVPSRALCDDCVKKL
jgi:hypothetical protein